MALTPAVGARVRAVRPLVSLALGWGLLGSVSWSSTALGAPTVEDPTAEDWVDTSEGADVGESSGGRAQSTTEQPSEGTSEPNSDVPRSGVRSSVGVEADATAAPAGEAEVEQDLGISETGTDEESRLSSPSPNVPLFEGTPFPDITAPKRLTGMAEVTLGWLTLPGALVCVEPEAGCRRGDTTPVVEIWNFVRLDLSLALGAGLSLGLLPTTDAPLRDPPGIDREHRRGYMTVEGMGRYYPISGGTVEAWVGLGGGLVIVSDNFVSTSGAPERPFIGTPGVTVRTEGFSLFLGGGLSVELSELWHVGAAARAGSWHLPKEPATSPLGDEASLTGRTTVIYAGLNVSLHAQL